MKHTRKSYVICVVMCMAIWLFSSCNRSERIEISSEQLNFLWVESSQTVSVKANCSWTVENENNADWLTIEPTSGEKDGVFSVTVLKNESDADREAMIKIVSKKAKTIKYVKVLQTTDIVTSGVDFSFLINSCWGISREEQWNTDFYNEVIPDTYHLWEFNPNDTTNGFVMFFLHNDSLGCFGFQRDNRGDSAVYYPFNYVIDSINNQLFLSFELVDTIQVEEYTVDVQSLNSSSFKFWHEYKPHFFERSELQLLGSVTPRTKSFVMPKAFGRKPADTPIFNMK